MSKIRSSLDPKELAKRGLDKDVHTFRQGNSLLITESTRVQGGESTMGLMPLVEDVTHDALEDFELKPSMDCRYEAAQVVKAINHHKSPSREVAAKRAFLDKLEELNICPRCRCPIRVHKAVEQITKLEEQDDGSVVRVPDPERVEKHEKVLRRTEQGWKAKDYRIPRYKWDSSRPKFYVDIAAHYEWWNPEGSQAYYYYVDGTGRDIRLERLSVPYKRKARRFWEHQEADSDGMVTRTRFRERFVEVLEDGTRVPVVPEPSYRLFNTKCECKFRRRERAIKVPKV
jgi:hypothetical protein